MHCFERKNYLKTVTLIIFKVLVFTSLSVKAGHFAIIEQNNKKGLVNEKGEIIIPAEHDDLGWSKGESEVLNHVIGFKKDGKWGLLNTKNQKIIPAEYYDLYPYNDENLICSRKIMGELNPVYGIISVKGKVILDFEYDHLEKSGNRLIIGSKERNNIKYGLIDVEGEAFLSIKHKRIQPLNGHLYSVSDDLYSYNLYNSQGKKVISDTFDSIGVFHGKYASVYKNGHTGLIDGNGMLIVQPKYKEIKVDENGGISVKPFPKWQLFDQNYQLRAIYNYDRVSPFEKLVFKVNTGKVEALVNVNDENLTPFKNFNFLQLVDTLVSYSYRNKQGVMSIYGHQIIPAEYDSVYIDHPHILLYTKTTSRKGWKLAEINGEIVSNESYDNIQRLNELLFRIKKGKYWGLMKKDGSEHVLCKYDSIEDFFEGRLRVHFFGENGILDEEGSWIILPQKQEIDLLPGNRYLIRSIYGSEVSSFDGNILFKTDYFLYTHGENFLEKNLDKEFSVFRNDGKRLCPTVYTNISELQEDSIYFARKESETSFITKNGRTLNYMDPRFEEIRPMSESFIGVKIDGKYGFVDPNGDLRIANRYEEIGEFNNGLAPVQIMGKWGFVDKIERIVIQPRYSDAIGYDNGIFVVEQGDKYGIVDKTGNIIVRVEYDKIEKMESGYFECQMGDRFGLINQYGQITVLSRFETLSDLQNGLLIVSRKNKYGLITTEGLDVMPMIYDEIVYDPINNLYLAKTNSEWRKVN